jgi:toxin YoeB
MIYEVRLSQQVKLDLVRLAKSEPKAFAKANRFLEELRIHPKTGTGHPEPLKGKPENRWSREITKKHRLVYRIFDTEVYVEVLTAYGHYDDK